jgi:transcriptional regulator with XRE-family HTH domain
VPLGPRIRERRLELGLSLREFARRVGVSPPFVTDLEAGRRNPSAEILGRIAAVLDLPGSELESLDTRLTPEVRRWVESEPEVGRLLRRLKRSPRRDEMLRRLRRMVDEEQDP